MVRIMRRQDKRGRQYGKAKDSDEHIDGDNVSWKRSVLVQKFDDGAEYEGEDEVTNRWWRKRERYSKKTESINNKRK